MDEIYRRSLKVAVLYTRLSGYITSCLAELKNRHDVELSVYAYPAQGDAPFSKKEFSGLGSVADRFSLTEAQILSELKAYKPDVILVSGWGDSGYLSICRKMKAIGTMVISGCDTQWKGSMRQRLAGLVAPVHLQKCFDVLWVTGERQRWLAARLGFHGVRCWGGFYACDRDRFSVVAKKRLEVGARVSDMGPQSSFVDQTTVDRPDVGIKQKRQRGRFLFVGRYVAVKGLDTLAAAYRDYCSRVEAPWELVCAGKGPLRECLMRAGAIDRGFVQPAELPRLMGSASAFLLPSRFEPWGVVLQEATASGLPVIASEACGAAVHLLRDGWNGYLFETGNVDHLAEAMTRMHKASLEQRAEMGEASFQLSKQFTPELWARQLINGVTRWKIARQGTLQK